METRFASPERIPREALAGEVTEVAAHPVLSTLLSSVGGLLAVLNQHRQILAVNETYLAFLGIEDPGGLLGLRPGESVGCVHAGEMPAGCGTAIACGACGAAIALVSSLEGGLPKEGTCALQVTRHGVVQDLFLKIRATPLDLGGRRLILLSLVDFTREQNHALLERVFFHDVNNLVGAILGHSELLELDPRSSYPESARHMRQLAQRLAREMEIQQTFAQSRSLEMELDLREIDAASLIREVEVSFAHRQEHLGVSILTEGPKGLAVCTDPELLSRVLSNMVTNALEASSPGESVRLSAARVDGEVVFSVWNARPVPPEVAAHIFQRNFSTKADFGRGLGTYSMKLFGEQVLMGKVAFTSSPEEGTTFTLRLPAHDVGSR